MDDTASPTAVDSYESGGCSEGTLIAEHVLHAPEIAASLLADGEGEKDRTARLDSAVHQGTRYGDRDGKTSRVVDDSGADPAVADAADVDWYLGSEYRVDVGGDDDGRGAGITAGGRERGEQVADLIELGSDLGPELGSDELGASTLTERGGRSAGERELGLEDGVSL